MLVKRSLCHERRDSADCTEHQRRRLHSGIYAGNFWQTSLDSVFTDIYPDAVKIGMVSSGALIRTIAEKLKEYEAKNIVVDPVMVATSGAKLINDEAIGTLKECLFPLAAVLTPNIPEAEVLSGRKITSKEGMEEAAEMIGRTYHCADSFKEEDISLMTPMTCFTATGKADGFTENGLTIPIHTAPDVRCPAQSPLACKGIRPGRSGRTGKAVHFRSPGSHAGSGRRQRPDGSRL